jgi:pimeloyl-ACP methyl ester carboxylesterase
MTYYVLRWEEICFCQRGAGTIDPGGCLFVPPSPIRRKPARGETMPCCSVDGPVSTETAQSGVVLLHGIARTSRSLGKLQRALEAAGFKTLNLGYESRRKSLEQLAEDIHPAIGRFADGVAGQLHFVGHSMGGLLARVYLAKHRPERLGRVVMLGTPNGGSEIADHLRGFVLYRAYFGPAGQQLTTRRDPATERLLPAVSYAVGVIAGNRSIYPISSALLLPRPNDGRVSVENTKLDGMVDHIVVATSHPRLPQNASVIQQTIAFLLDGRFGAAHHEKGPGRTGAFDNIAFFKTNQRE